MIICRIRCKDVEKHRDKKGFKKIKITALGRPRQEDSEFNASVGYIAHFRTAWPI
jgi:hypothetical protein